MTTATYLRKNLSYLRDTLQLSIWSYSCCCRCCYFVVVLLLDGGGAVDGVGVDGSGGYINGMSVCANSFLWWLSLRDSGCAVEFVVFMIE